MRCLIDPRAYGDYINWLIDILHVEVSGASYNFLMNYLAEVEFVPMVKNDGNRAEDGLEIRSEYMSDYDLVGNYALEEMPCSVLEMMVALAMRMADYSPETTGLININSPETRENFMILLSNLGLLDYSDDYFDKDVVEDIVLNMVERRYKVNGEGGLFPLQGPCPDQRNLEIWYQMQQYFLENL